MKKKKAVLLDLDNTIYNYDEPHKKALNAVYKKLKQIIKITRKRFDYLYKISKQEIHKELSGTASAHNRILYFQRLIEKTHNTVDPSIILKLHTTYWKTFYKNMKITKTALDTLREIKKQGYKTAIVSDMTTEIQLQKMKKLNITNYIDYLITSEEAGSEKPHQIMFLLALNKLKIKPEEAIMVGDNTTADIEGANSVGLDTVLIKQGKLSKKPIEDFESPNYIIKNISEILNILTKK